MTSYINLTQGKVAIVDDELFGELNKHKWYVHNTGKNFYGRRDTGGRKFKRRIYLHRQVAEMLGIDTSKHIDHQDGNGLNNQASNLRSATRSQNLCNQRLSTKNTSGHKGVWFSKFRQKWVAELTYEGKKKHIGAFPTAHAAALAYNEAAKEIHGQFARINTNVA